MSSVEQQREDKQPLVKPSALVAALFTSLYGISGTILGTALTAMIITVGSAPLLQWGSRLGLCLQRSTRIHPTT
jgi:hypothetical protein